MESLCEPGAARGRPSPHTAARLGTPIPSPPLLGHVWAHSALLERSRSSALATYCVRGLSFAAFG
jgi:hypothetical protein